MIASPSPPDRGDALRVVGWLALAQSVAGAAAWRFGVIPEYQVGPAESAGLSAGYVLAVFAATTLMLYLLRRRLLSLLRLLISASLSLSTLVTTAYLLESAGLRPEVYLPASCAAALLVLRPGLPGNAAKAVSAGALGYFFSTLFPTHFSLILLAMMAAYDAYAVFRGPLSRILSDAASVSEPRGGRVMDLLTIQTGGVSIGYGDAFFYSLATAVSVGSLPPVPALASVVALEAGIAATLLALPKVGRPLPGLTLPVALWLASLLLWGP